MTAPKSHMSDDLLRQLQSDDARIREAVFSELRVRFVRLTKRRIGEQEAEDIAQEACVTVFEKCRDLPPDTNFAAWAYQVLRNKIGNRLQQRVRNTVTSAEIAETLAGPTESTSLELRVAACLRRIFRLNVRYARVLNLAHLGYSAEEICNRLAISKENFYVLLNRSRHQLRRCLEETKRDE